MAEADIIEIYFDPETNELYEVIVPAGIVGELQYRRELSEEEWSELEKRVKKLGEWNLNNFRGESFR